MRIPFSYIRKFLVVVAGASIHGCALPTQAEPNLQEQDYGIAIVETSDSVPRPVALSGHSDGITDIAVTSDGKYLLTASSDWAIIMWDIVEQKVVRRFIGHKASVSSIDLSPDGSHLVSGSVDETVRVWNLLTGAEVQRFILRPNALLDAGAKVFDGGLTGNRYKMVTSVAFAPDGEHILCGSEIGLWLVHWRTAAQVRHYNPKGIAAIESRVKSIVFSPNGKQILTATGEGIVGHAQLWGAETGENTGSFDDIEGSTVAVAFTPQGPRVVSTLDSGEVQLWDFNQTRLIQRFEGHSAAALSAAISPDGTRLLTGGADESVRVWDTASGTEIAKFDIPGRVNSVAFYPEQNFVFGAAFSGARLWRVQEPMLSRTYYGNAASPPQATAMTRSGRYIANGDSGGNVTVWDLHSGQRVRLLEGHSKWIESLAFSSDGTRLLTGAADQTMRLWDVESGKEISQWTGFPESVSSVALSPDNQHYLSATQEELLLWAVGNERPVRAFGSGWSKTLGGDVKLAMFSPDPSGRFVAAAYWNYETGIRIWNTRTAELVWKLGGVLSGHRDTITSFAFHPTANRILSGSKDKTIRVWDLDTGKQIKRLDLPTEVKGVAYHPYGQKALAVLEDNIIQLWDLETGTLIRPYRGHWAAVNWASFSPDGKYFLSVGDDSTQRIWDVESGQQLAIYFQTFFGEWLAYTPDGLFDGSASGWNSLAWRFSEEAGGGTSTLPIEVFFKEYFYPRLLPDLFSGRRPKAPSEVAKVDRRQPVVSFENPNSGQDIDERRINITVEVNDTGSGMQDLRVFRNGTLVHTVRGSLPPNAGAQTFRVPVPVTLMAGRNALTAYAFNNNDIKSGDAILELTGAVELDRKGRAYVVAIGIDKYQNDKFNLRYAAADADLVLQSLSDSFERQDLYEEIVPVRLLDKNASKANILAVLGLLSGELSNPPEGAAEDLFKLRAAEPEDLLIIYFAGHGMAHRDQYFLLPHDLGYAGEPASADEQGLLSIRGHSISDRDLEVAFEGVDAERIMLVIDACQSGQVLEAEEKRRGPMNSKGLVQLAYEKGMYVLAAAQSHQAALEIAVLGHGLLTHVLMEEGLRNMAADLNGDGQLTARELLDYPAQRMTAGTEAGNQRLVEHFEERGVLPAIGPVETTTQAPSAYYRWQDQRVPWVIAVEHLPGTE